MAQAARWIWGLVPLTLLWGLGNLHLAGPIQQDVARRATEVATAAAGSAPGTRPISVEIAGRDVAISGEALSEDGAARAMAKLSAEFGIRRAIGGLTQVVPRRPYDWSASRTADAVALDGHVPDEATAAALVAAARAAVPGARIEDGQVLAFGAPPAFGATARGLVETLAKLTRGKVSLDGTRLCIEGEAREPADVAMLRAPAAPAGFQPIACGIEPPVVAPYRWSVAQGNDGAVVAAGFLPSPELRQEMLTALRRAFPTPPVLDDRTLPARGAPAAFAERMRRAIADVARLRGGRAELEGDSYRLQGQGPDDYAACEALRLAVAQVDGPDSVAQAVIACPPAPVVVPPLPEVPLPVLPFEPAPAAEAQATAAPNPAPPPLTATSPPGAAATRPGAETGQPGAAVPQAGLVAAPPSAAAQPSAEPAPPSSPAAASPALAASSAAPETPRIETASPQTPSLETASPEAAARAAMPLPLASAPVAAEPASAAARDAPVPDVVVPALPEIPPFLPPAPPPEPVPLRWSAQWREGVLALSGLARDVATRDAVLNAARRLPAVGGVEQALTLEPNLAEAPDYAAATRFALDLVRRLSRGGVSIAGDRLALTGEAATPAALEALLRELAVRPLPAGLMLDSAPAALALRPYRLDLSLAGSGVALSGYLPDAATRAALAALIEASPLRLALSDATVLAPGAPEGFAPAARAALANLLRLDLGSASLDTTRLSLRGLTCRKLIKTEVETGAATGLPAGYAADTVIGLRQTGCVIDPPNTCQNDLDALTRRNAVMFAQGTTVVTLDATTERVLAEVLAILKQCPASRVVIEGHANNDGERTRFNNLDLSQRRALRVREELVRRGLPGDQLAVIGYGVERPLQPHGAPEARVVNRRVQFTVAK